MSSSIYLDLLNRLRQGLRPPFDYAHLIAVGIEEEYDKIIKDMLNVIRSNGASIRIIEAPFKHGKSTLLSYIYNRICEDVGKRGYDILVSYVDLSETVDTLTASWKFIYRMFVRNLAGSDREPFEILVDLACFLYEIYGDIETYKALYEVFGSRKLAETLYEASLYVKRYGEDYSSIRSRIQNLIDTVAIGLDFTSEVQAYNAFKLMLKLLKRILKISGILLLVDEVDVLMDVKPDIIRDFLSKLISLIEIRDAEDPPLLMVLALTGRTYRFLSKIYPRITRWENSILTLKAFSLDDVYKLYNKMREIYMKAYPNQASQLEKLTPPKTFLLQLASEPTKADTVQKLVEYFDSQIKKAITRPSPSVDIGKIEQNIIYYGYTYYSRGAGTEVGKIFEEGINRILDALKTKRIITDYERKIFIQGIKRGEKELDFRINLNNTLIGVQVMYTDQEAVGIAEVRPIFEGIARGKIHKGLFIFGGAGAARFTTTIYRHYRNETEKCYVLKISQEETLRNILGLGALKETEYYNIKANKEAYNDFYKKILEPRIINPLKLTQTLKQLSEGKIYMKVNKRGEYKLYTKYF